MVIRLETKLPDGSILEGNGLLFFAHRNVDAGAMAHAVPGQAANAPPSKPIPVIATLWHVVGINATSPVDIQSCMLVTPEPDSGEYAVTKILARCPLSEIDLELSKKINTPDGVCLLAPGMGFDVVKPSPSKLAIPPLQPPPVLSTDVLICIVRSNGGIITQDFLAAGGRPQKRQHNDTYSFPGATGLIGRGSSGGAVIPDEEHLTNPPELVFGFHCGHDHYPQPPDNYIFIGTAALGKMLSGIGLYHPVVDYRAPVSGDEPPPNAVVTGISNGLKWLLNKLAPT